ncbi:glycosyltransferase involved in cell wall biosynthesis [Leucobacter exalbidus]|uniref:Glycosyltransferase involved in cell wall biosynthesis n=1 Tax=Leucobacter exalbidus TaxID=662960 RepID=A0A940PRJ0_9MICO|nr:glycosyltransferase family A protein [Leucobacter exalbidus]MBP1326224.1 glycosyltransferase involved in cell wall biosynthesis [Leucobacter exalbidus]
MNTHEEPRPAPRVSIVVPSRGGVERLPKLFECLRAQTEPSWEVVVVVDGDIDDTADLLERVRHELPVTPIVFPENRGRSAALNAGFAAARGEVLVRCDDDLRPDPGYVAAHLAQHTGEPRGAIGLVRNIYPETAYARAYGLERDTRFREEAYHATPERRWRYWGGNVSVTRETYDRVGPYDTNFRAYGWEDVDWGYRLYASGTPVDFAFDAETDHWIAATTTESRVRRAFYSGAARLTFDAKHGAGVSGSTARGTGLWDRLVTHQAQRSLADLSRSAAKLDTALDRMPRWLAEKRVSLLVEAAAVSGLLHPEQVANDV